MFLIQSERKIFFKKNNNCLFSKHNNLSYIVHLHTIKSPKSGFCIDFLSFMHQKQVNKQIIITISYTSFKLVNKSETI